MGSQERVVFSVTPAAGCSAGWIFIGSSSVVSECEVIGALASLKVFVIPRTTIRLSTKLMEMLSNSESRRPEENFLNSDFPALA